MLHRIATIPVLALAFGAADTVLVRREFAHRDLGPELFAQSVALWLAMGVVGIVACLVWRRLARRGRRLRGRGTAIEPARGPVDEIVSQVAWTAGPVALHMAMNPHTDLGGDVSGLLSLGALRDVTLAVVALIALVALTRALVSRLRPALVGAVVALLALSVGLLWTVHVEGEHAPGADPARVAEAGDERPNVLLMIWDTSRAKSLSITGYRRETTPRLAKLAESSLWFKRARSVSSYTLTSHLSMLTGAYPSHHGARMLRQISDPYRTPSVAQDFAAAGYRTGAFVGTAVLAARTGVIAGFEVFDDLVDPPVCDTHAWALVHDVQAIVAKLPGLGSNGLPHWIQDMQRPADEVLADAAEWIERPDPRPWFCMINMYDVHWPYLPREEPRERWVAPYEGPMTGYLFRANGWDPDYEIQPDDRNHVKELYDAETWDLDRQVGQFLDRLDLDRTALVITSDHGEAFGEGGEWEHNDILECQVRVPLLVRPAGGVEGRIDTTPTTGVDVAPTLLDLAGLLDESWLAGPFDPEAPERPAATGLPGGGDPPAGDIPRFFGFSLLRELPERAILVEDRDHLDPTEVRIAIYGRRFKLIREGVGDDVRYVLHDLTVDPDGRNDRSEEFPEAVRILSGRLERERARWGASDEADAQNLRHSNLDALKQLGYADGHAGNDPHP